MRPSTRICLLFTLLLMPAAVEAQVTRLVITRTESPTFEGTRFGSVGQYEWLIGYAEGELDPRDPRNAGILLLDKAPRNAKGMVEYRVDVEILRPVDMSRANGRIVYEVLNRGNKNIMAERVNGGPPINDPHLAAHAGTGFFMNRGYTVVWSGWQGDIDYGGNRGRRMIAKFPIAKNADGSPIVGMVMQEYIFGNPTNPITVTGEPLGNAGSLWYPAADLDPSKASLTVRQYSSDPRQKPADLSWSYVSPTELRINRPAGFDAGAIYEFVYPARDPKVMGMGFAAVRDVVSFLRYETKDAGGTTNPLAGRIQRTIGIGFSQSGRYLRDYLYQGFNEDLRGRIVFDGLMPAVAGTKQTDLNRIFSVPGDVQNQHDKSLSRVHEFPFSYGVTRDPITGKTAGLLMRCEASKTCPNVFNIDSDTEVWQSAAALNVTGVDGMPLKVPENVRWYVNSGSQHYPSPTPAYGSCQQLGNPFTVDAPIRALVVAMDEWITNGTLPPDGHTPSVADGTLVPATHPRAAYPAIPGFRYLGNVNVPRVRDYNVVPPKELGPTYPTFVIAKDADGNNVAGIPQPFLEVPTATYSGWNLLKKGFGENELCGFSGSYIPFAKTKAERLANGDQRLSLEERYPTHAAYVDLVKQSAARLVKARLLLQEDVDRIVKLAEDSDVRK